MQEPLVQLKNVDVSLNGRLVLKQLNWQLLPGQHWAVLGGNGAGKSTFLKLVRGEVWPDSGRGERIYRLHSKQQRAAVGIKEQMPLVSPEAQDRYLQIEWKLRTADVIHSGFRGTDYLYHKPTARQRKRADAIIKLLGIESLLDRDVQSLSTGELRRVLIARALVSRPAVLLLDEVCDGLDAPTRRDFLAVLNRIARSGTQLIYTTHRAEELVPAITHTLVLGRGRILRQSPVGDPSHASQPSRKPNRSAGKAAGVNRLATRALIRIERADVYLDRKRVLHRIAWQMEDGQNWAVFGANGSGKTTFLKLLCGDVHPAAGGRVRRFDLTSRNTLWDIRRRIGFVSPALQATYRERLTGAEVVASGFFASIGLLDRVTLAQSRRIRELLKRFGLEHLAKVPALKMSYGEFRKLLLLRALVRDPAILVCDEPFDGLDLYARRAFTAALDNVAQNGTRLVTVTHHLAELPRSITHALVLENGQIVCEGALDEVRQHPASRRLFADE